MIRAIDAEVIVPRLSVAKLKPKSRIQPSGPPITKAVSEIPRPVRGKLGGKVQARHTAAVSSSAITVRAGGIRTAIAFASPAAIVWTRRAAPPARAVHAGKTIRAAAAAASSR